MREIQASEGSSASSSTGPASSSVWHAIRPWTPHLTLAVLEITSVSVTFILSSTLDSRASAAISSEVDEADTESNVEQHASAPVATSATAATSSATPSTSTSSVSVIDTSGPVLADVLSQGLHVDVNGSNWQRYILRMLDATDEAILLIYGLHPGRQYDIDIALAGGAVVGRRMVVTNDEAELNGEGDEHEENGVATHVENNTTATAHSAADAMSFETPPIVGALLIPDGSHLLSPSPSPSPSTPVLHSPSPSPAPASSTLAQTHEERLQTLTTTLSELNEEQATLQASLRTTRRDTQKVSTALRGEIDALRRASEKAVVAEGKARQRVRTLEDAVRRANDSREEIEQELEQNENAMPALREREASAEEELKRTKAEADEVKSEREKREAEVRKRKENSRTEYVSLTQRLERLGVKRERFEGSVIPGLEAQLAEIERKIELTERRTRPQQGDGGKEGATGGLQGRSQGRRQSHAGIIGRPSSNAVQKSIPTSTQVNSPPQISRHQPRSNSMHRKATDGGPPGLPPPPGIGPPPGFMNNTSSGSVSHATSSVPLSPRSSHSNTMLYNSTSSMSPSLSRSTGSTASSTLSSKALPFEPSRSFRSSFSLSSSTGNAPPSGMFSTGMGQNTYGSSSSMVGGPLLASTGRSLPNPGVQFPFMSSSMVPAFPNGPSTTMTLPPPIQRPSHVSGSNTSPSGASASVTSQLLRIGRPAPAAISKIGNGEHTHRQTGSSG
ncbi:hypothetical protein ID866_4179 [Astraeus odoratus]|nr:hypothetical protein ID866_4179 [Astraeus odoratus]